ncbi:putative transcriptional repressor rco-1 protein [Rutstroemia sp. NJR-2017a WRK4]|nr:putative transcriptional repressor rco-1 protein [Rutstroemia sp. NJR-2017a WRK4]
MSSTPVNPRTFAANTGLGLKLSPSNSPFTRTPRSSNKARNPYESGLSLKKIIGTTVTSPPCFDSLPTSRLFAYTAGATVVVVDIDDEGKHAQRFFRARPTAVPSNGIQTSTGGPSASSNTANDGRNRSTGGIRDTAIPFAPSIPHTSLEANDSSSRTWSSRERIKAATCVSISPDGRFLAVGETGYSPRVLIFSLQDTSSDTPLAILNEHTYGVGAIAFSPDGKYLASLGTVNDGFLHVWAINSKAGTAKLHSSNKCTSLIKQMVWLGGNIITVGIRHIKVWRVEERCPSPKQKFAMDGTPQPMPVQQTLKTLAGRNCLLGPLAEATFTCIAPFSDHRAIVCSEKGDVCLLDSNEGQKLLKVLGAGFPVTCVAIHPETRQVRIGGRSGKIKAISLDSMLTPSTPPPSPLFNEGFIDESDSGHLCAMGYAGRDFVTMDSRHFIEISGPDSNSAAGDMKNSILPAHGDAVMGVKLLPETNSLDAAFLTWSVDGSLVFWDAQGNSKSSIDVEVEQVFTEEDAQNQCQVVQVSKDVKFLVTGDRYGVLKMIDISTKKCTFETRAHSSEIQDIIIHEDETSTLVATCGRDRTIQLFRRASENWELVQTLDEHTAGVCGLFFAENGEKLVSYSVDRTIHIRQLVKRDGDGGDVLAAIPLRIITLKAAPVSMTPCSGDQAGNLVVSLLDRTVATYEISSGRLVTSFKAIDTEGTEAVVMDSLVLGTPNQLSGRRSTIIAGVSNTDKSVRVYDWTTGSFLDKEWGHTGNVTGAALLENKNSTTKLLASTGLDGTIMLWELSRSVTDNQEPSEQDSNISEEQPMKEPTVTMARPPLRKVLSKAELAEFQRASPSSTPTGPSSPPRPVRRKSSKLNLTNQTPSLSVPPVPNIQSKHLTSASEDSTARKGSPRTRSRSPPSPQSKDVRRPSVPSLDTRSRSKALGSNASESGSLSMATEQACRALRAYRRKLNSSDSIKDDCIKELDQELRLTAAALGEKSLQSKAISEVVLAGLLDQYSDKLVSMFDEKLRISQLAASSRAGSPTGSAEAGKMVDGAGTTNTVAE